MVAANASARGQRAAILASPLHELTGFYLAVDCLVSGRRLPCAAVQWRARLCCSRACQLLRAGQHGGAGAAPHAVFRRVRRTCGRRLVGHWTDSERTGQAAAGAAVGSGGEGVVSSIIAVRVAALALTGGPGTCSQSSESLRLCGTRSRRLRDEYRTATCRCCASCQGLGNILFA
jgi:hypothetical protein